MIFFRVILSLLKYVLFLVSVCFSRDGVFSLVSTRVAFEPLPHFANFHIECVHIWSLLYVPFQITKQLLLMRITHHCLVVAIELGLPVYYHVIHLT